MSRAERLVGWAVWPLGLGSMATLLVGFVLSISAPLDVVQGAVMRILYIHAPCSWLGPFGYALASSLSLLFLTFRWPIVWPFVQESVRVGLMFTAISLITGSIWGGPTWGTWWVWDARLTSMLILLLTYLGANSLDGVLAQTRSGRVLTCVFILVGSVNLPIVHYSVLWWHTLHQGSSVMHFRRPAIDAAILGPLIIMALGHLMLFAFLVALGVYQKLQRRRLLRLMGL